jgi:hypothetical protein
MLLITIFISTLFLSRTVLRHTNFSLIFVMVSLQFCTSVDRQLSDASACSTAICFSA